MKRNASWRSLRRKIRFSLPEFFFGISTWKTKSTNLLRSGIFFSNLKPAPIPRREEGLGYDRCEAEAARRGEISIGMFALAVSRKVEKHTKHFRLFSCNLYFLSFRRQHGRILLNAWKALLFFKIWICFGGGREQNFVCLFHSGRLDGNHIINKRGARWTEITAA